MLVEERRGRLLELVRSRGFASLQDLKAALQVSESTIRRDLEHLEGSGSAQRSHGGAFYTGPSPKLPHFDLRQANHADKKKRIAARAAELIEEGETLLLDGGSTTYELAQLLVGRSLQVVTNSLPVANLIMSSPTAKLVVIGGDVDSATGVTRGPFANKMLELLNVRRAVISVGGIHDNGYYNSDALLVETERAMMRAADEVIVVADSTKFGRKNIAHLGELGAIDVLVVDNEITQDWRSKLIAAGVKLIVAGETDN